MADLSKITLPSGTTYNLKDAKAREDIAAIEAAIAGGVSFLGITTTALTDGATTNPITIGGQSVSAINGCIVIYGSKEFIWADADTSWHLLGSADEFGALAFKDSASGSFTPHGSVSTPTITVTPSNTTVNSIDDVGTLPTWSATVANENLTISWSQGTLPTKGSDTTVVSGIQSATSSQPTFTGTGVTVTVS